MTIDETGKLVEVLVEAFRPQRIGDGSAQVAAFHLALDDVPYELGQLAVRQVIRTRAEYGMPYPAAVRAIAVELAQPLEDPDDAWRVVERELSTSPYFGGGVPAFDNPAIAATVRAIGWHNIRMGDIHKTPAAFKEMYATKRKQTQETANPALLWTGALPAGSGVS